MTRLKAAPRTLVLGVLAAIMLLALFGWGSAQLIYASKQQEVMQAQADLLGATMEKDHAEEQAFYGEAEQTVRFFAALPAVANIGHLIAHPAQASFKGQTLAQWKERFGIVGTVFTKANSRFFQVRLLGVAEGGRELVRVVQSQTGQVSKAGAQDLQVKGDRDYFTRALTLPAGQVYLSPIDLNIENGQIEQPPRPTLRAAMPVRDERGQVFAVVVVNLQAQPLIDLLKDDQPDTQEWLTNAAGQYLMHPQPGRAFEHLLKPPGTPFAQDFPTAPEVPALAGLTLPAAVTASVRRAPDGADWFMLTRTLRPPKTYGDGGLVLHAGVPMSDLRAQARAAAAPLVVLVWFLGLALWGLGVDLIRRFLRVERRQKPRLTKPDPRPLGQVVASALLPLAWWAVMGLGLPAEQLGFPFVLMLLPAVLAGYWGGLTAGLVASVLAGLLGWDLATPDTPLLDMGMGGQSPLPLTLSALATVLAGCLVAYLQESVRRRAAQVRESRQQLQGVIDASPAVMYTCRYGGDWATTFISAKVTQLLGYTVEECFEPGWWVGALHPEDRDRVLTGLAALSEQGYHSHEYRMANKQGQWCWVYDEMIVVHDEQGKPSYCSGALLDITERQAAEAALRESEAKFRDLWESSRDAKVLCWPPHWQFSGGNAAAVALFGVRDAEHLASLRSADLSPERQPDGELTSEKGQRYIAEVLGKGGKTFEWMHRRPDGTEFLCEVQATRVEIDGMTGFFVSVRDITERKAAEAELKRALAERTTLLDEVHHRVKNNLQVVSSLLYLQQDQAGDAQVVAQLQLARDRIAAISLVHERLYRTANFGQIEMRPFFSELCAGVLGAADGTGRLRFEVNGEDFTLRLSEAVPVALIFNELLTNAAKHAFPGGRDGLIRCTLERSATGQRIVRLTDDGVGMIQGYKGQSIGLGLVQRLAGQVSATLTLADSVQGTAWQLALPRTESEEG